MSRPSPSPAVTPAAAPEAVTAAPARPGVRLIALSAAFTLAVAVAGYWWTGTPAAIGGHAATTAAASESEAEQVKQFTAMVDKLAARMDQQPSAEGLSMLGRSYLVLGRPQDAVKAYERALKLEPTNANVLADMADALGVRNNNSLTGEPMAMVERALKIDPDNLKALMLAGSEAFDRRDAVGAIRHWQRMVDKGPADHPLVRQAAAGIEEVRKATGVGGAGAGPSLAGGPGPAPGPAAGPMAGGPMAAGPAPGPGPRTTAAPAAAAGARITGSVSVVAGLAGVSPEDTVFIFARPAEGARVPLAVLRKQVRDLPSDFSLDDSLAMSPAARLSQASSVIVGARISKSGNPMSQPGDIEVLSAPVAPGAQGLKLVLGAPLSR